MNTHSSTFDQPPSRRAYRHGGAGLMLAFLLALQSPILLAQQTDAVAKANSHSAAQAEMPWLSGGIGDEALQEMRKVAAAYNVHVMFSHRQGAYLANVPFKVAGADGRQIHSGISEGPLLYLKLAPGAYQVSAEIDGKWQNRQIRAGAANSSVKLMFVAAREG